MGGPNGGNGGKGGDVIFVADLDLTTLMDLTYNPHFTASEGNPGQSWNKAGLYGEDLRVRVPCGTLVYCEGVLLADMKEDGMELVVARGGRGGRGNSSFKTIRNTAPKMSENGEPGEMKTLELELKLLADVGLVGFPNAGKSTLLSRISAARPKIANYPFTTLSPNLGVATVHGKSFVVADIPGLIEGAHAGKGLGIDFLRHVERTRVLVHIIDLMGSDGNPPYQNFHTIRKELELYSKKLGKLPTVIAANKMDLTDSEESLKVLKKKLKGKKIIPISAVTGLGIDMLMNEVAKILAKAKKETAPTAEPRVVEAVKKYALTNEFTVERLPDGIMVKGARVERLTAMTNFKQPQSVRRFWNILRKMGVERGLKKHGVEDGETVWIGVYEFTYDSTKMFPNLKDLL
jgi:GTP-binding protein